MDNSQLIEYIKNKTISSFQRRVTQTRTLQLPSQTETYPMDVNLGSQAVYFNKQRIPTLACCSPLSYPLPDPVPCIVNDLVLYALNELLQYIALKNYGPTITSREIYLFFFTISSGFTWTRLSSPVTGTHDSWNWDTHYPLSDMDNFLFTLYLISDIMTIFVPTFNSQQFISYNASLLGWSSDKMQYELNRVTVTGHYSEWKSAWTTWYTTRSIDGSVAAKEVPADSSLPNGTNSIEVSAAQDFSTFSAQDKWTPLKFSTTKRQKYLTYSWEDVNSTMQLSPQEIAAIKQAGLIYFPIDESARQQEIQTVVNITANLTDEQKVIAEFWAGGPTTVSPPGMCIWLWKEYMRGIIPSPQTFLFSGLDLAIHLFEGGRFTWGLKKDKMQSRPIQDIRRWYSTQTIKLWDGTDISGSLWTPYQESNFVTPPFADFPSGHSHFSRAFANVMNRWFGQIIQPIQMRPVSDMNLMSPMFSSIYNGKYGEFTIPAKSSQIQPSIVPSIPITLKWTTWNEMAESAGQSRFYGGIHATSAHTSSVAIADALDTKIREQWNIQI